MRRGELSILKKSNISQVEESTLYLLKIEDSKNGEEREIPLNAEALEVLHAQGNGKGENDLLFTFHMDSLTKAVKRARERIVKRNPDFKIRTHWLRHTKVSELVEDDANLNMLEVMAISGHKDTQIVKKRYYKANITNIAKKLAGKAVESTEKVWYNQCPSSRADLAQLVEQRIRNAWVASSIPAIGTT